MNEVCFFNTSGVSTAASPPSAIPKPTNSDPTDDDDGINGPEALIEMSKGNCKVSKVPYTSGGIGIVGWGPPNYQRYPGKWEIPDIKSPIYPYNTWVFMGYYPQESLYKPYKYHGAHTVRGATPFLVPVPYWNRLEIPTRAWRIIPVFEPWSEFGHFIKGICCSI